MESRPKNFAYHFRYLQIDLSTGKNCQIDLDEQRLRHSIGGAGLGVELLLQTASAELDPFDSRASLFFVFSPLVGSALTTSAKFAVVSKSPLTGRINDSLAGSGFAIAGKRTGFDAIEIIGAAKQPSIIVVENDRVRIEACPDLWGLSIPDCDKSLRKHFDSRFRIASIGPAGENKVLFATISHDGRHAGRGGSGAVLGSKNIKAILVAGDQNVKWAKPESLNQFAKGLSKRSFGSATAKYRELGTAGNLLTFNRLQCLPTRNFRDNQIENAESLSPEMMAKDRKKVRSSCAACTIGCEHLYGIQKGSNGGTSKNVRMEYESLFALGPMCGINDPDVVLSAAQICDEAGIDTISAGATIAFAMDCAERNWISEKLNFGDGPTLLRLLTQISTRQGIGDHLANGSRQFANEIGGSAIDFAPQIKGLEIPGYDPRKLSTMALGFAVGSRGADHNKSSAYEIDFREDSSKNFSAKQISEAVFIEDKSAVMDSLIFCKFLRGVFDDFFTEVSEIYELVSGWKLSPKEIRQVGSKLIENKKLFNVRAGWMPIEDQLPQHFFHSSEKNVQAIFTKDELSSAIREYNILRGWTPVGFPKTFSGNRKENI